MHAGVSAIFRQYCLFRIAHFSRFREFCETKHFLVCLVCPRVYVAVANFVAGIHIKVFTWFFGCFVLRYADIAMGGRGRGTALIRIVFLYELENGSVAWNLGTRSRRNFAMFAKL